MGTTRMGLSTADSVVDSNCRVHTTDNLYVAGSSVFPAGGASNPTYTMVAMALRLGAHLASTLHHGINHKTVISLARHEPLIIYKGFYYTQTELELYALAYLHKSAQLNIGVRS